MSTWMLTGLAIILWGSWAIFEKKVIGEIHPFWSMIYYSVMLLFTIPVYYFLTVKNGIPFEFKWKAVGWTFLCVISASGASIAFLHLVSTKPVAWVAPITSAYPLITLLIGVLILGETITFTSVIGAVLIFAGIFLMSFQL